MTFADPGDLNNGDVFPEAWADQVRANFIAMSTWNSYTPTLTQSATVAKSVGHAYYVQLGDLVIGLVKMTPSGTGTASNKILSSLPVPHDHAIDSTVGFAYYFDTGVANYVLAVQTDAAAGGTGVKFIRDGDTSAWGTSGPTIGSGDILAFFFLYRAQ